MLDRNLYVLLMGIWNFEKEFSNFLKNYYKFIILFRIWFLEILFKKKESIYRFSFEYDCFWCYYLW